MSLGLEIEKKYHILEFSEYFKLEKYPYKKILQGYLKSWSKEFQLRIRKVTIGGESIFYFTLKKGTGLIRKEREFQISPNSFYYLWGYIEAQLEKTRYLIQDGKRTIELDIFERELKGINIAEVELNTQEESNSYILPDWFAKRVEEVTENELFSNKNLAYCGLPTDFQP